MQIEATEVFFAVTKLFQSKDTGLRRMVYLMIKEISPSADEVRQGLATLKCHHLTFNNLLLTYFVIY